MRTTVEIMTEISSFQIEIPDEQIDDLRRACRGDALADQGARRATDRKACSWRRCRSSPATGRPSTTGASARRD